MDERIISSAGPTHPSSLIETPAAYLRAAASIAIAIYYYCWLVPLSRRLLVDARLPDSLEC
jgi:hypothetical protein